MRIEKERPPNREIWIRGMEGTSLTRVLRIGVFCIYIQYIEMDIELKTLTNRRLSPEATDWGK